MSAPDLRAAFAGLRSSGPWMGIGLPPELRKLDATQLRAVARSHGMNAAKIERLAAMSANPAKWIGSHKCPTCGEGPALYASATQWMKCKKGHLSGPGSDSIQARAWAGAPATSKAAQRGTAQARQLVASAAKPKPPPLAYNLGTLYLNGRIGADGLIGFTGVTKKFAELRARGARAFFLELNSIGGNCEEAFHIAAQVRHMSRNAGPVVVYVSPGGVANSAATAIALEADYLILDPSATVSIHAPTGSDEGRRRAAQNRLEELYTRRTALPPDAIHPLLEACGDTTFHAGNAIQYGIVDEIGGRERALEVARACGSSAPSWPSNILSPRRAVLARRKS